MNTTQQSEHPQNELEATDEAIRNDQPGSHDPGDSASDPDPGWAFLQHQAQAVRTVLGDYEAQWVTRKEARALLRSIFREANRRQDA